MTDQDRIARNNALHYAIDHARGDMDADGIVQDTKKFHAFLTNTETEGK